MPSESEQQAAERQVKEVLGAQIAAASTPADCSKLAAQMLETAATTAEPASKFVLLRHAEDLAVLAGDVNALLAAHDALGKAFDLGNSRAAIEAFQKIVRAPLSADDLAKLCRGMVAAATDAVAADAFDSARHIGQLASTSSRRLNDPELAGKIAALMAAISINEAEHKRIAPTEAALAAKPDDPAANTAVGRYVCLVKHDWPRGLPMLAKGNDAALKSLAGMELNAPTAPNKQEALADAWWTYAESQRPDARPAIHLHAGEWYSLASSKLTGLAKLKADERAADYLKSLPPKPEVVAVVPPGEGPEGFTSPLQLLQSLPANLFPPTLAEWDDSHRNAVNDAMREHVLHHNATFLITVEKVLHSNSTSLVTFDQPMRVGQFSARVHMAFDSSYQDQWPSIREDGTYLVNGEVRTATFNASDRIELFLYLVNCRVVTHEQMAAAARKAAQPQTLSAAPPPSPRPAVVAGAKTEYASLEEVLAAVPLDQMPKTNEEWRDRNSGSQFGHAFHDAFMSKTVTCRITVERVDTRLRDTTDLRSPRYPVGPTHIDLNFRVPVGDPLLAGMQAGQTCTVRGKVAGLGWGPSALGITLTQCEIVQGK